MTFQTMVNDIFQDLIIEGIVVVYLDDILFFIWTLEKHTRAVQQVLEILAEYKLFLYSEKCEFEQKRIEYLGLVISRNKVEIDPVKISGICEWSVSKFWNNV